MKNVNKDDRGPAGEMTSQMDEQSVTSSVQLVIGHPRSLTASHIDKRQATMKK